MRAWHPLGVVRPSSKKTRDLLEVVEAAYAVDGDDETWLGGLVDAARPALDDGLGLFAYVVEIQGSKVVPSAVVHRTTLPGVADIVGVTNARATPAEVEALYRGPMVATLSETLGCEPIEHPALRDFYGPLGIHDTLGVIACDSPRRATTLAAPLRTLQTLDRKRRASWQRVAIHIATAMRLRRRITRDSAPPDAVLRPDGRIEHLEPGAKAPRTREVLRGHAAAIDRARGALRREDPEAALDLWRALAAARWSLVDGFERDGRRYLIARRNEPEAAGDRGLTALEQLVVERIAARRSSKAIAYELGLSASTISAFLSSAMVKLGVKTREELVQAVVVARTTTARD